MLKPEFTGQFKKDYKLAVKRGCDPQKLSAVVELLCEEKTLPPVYRDHALTNSRNYKDMRECHIQPDWLLVYKIERDALILKLIRTGSQAICFKESVPDGQNDQGNCGRIGRIKDCCK